MNISMNLALNMVMELPFHDEASKSTMVRWVVENLGFGDPQTIMVEVIDGPDGPAEDCRERVVQLDMFLLLTALIAGNGSSLWDDMGGLTMLWSRDGFSNDSLRIEPYVDRDGAIVDYLVVRDVGFVTEPMRAALTIPAES